MPELTCGITDYFNNNYYSYKEFTKTIIITPTESRQEQEIKVNSPHSQRTTSHQPKWTTSLPLVADEFQFKNY